MLNQPNVKKGGRRKQIGSLSKDDEDSNEEGKKVIDLDKQNNDSAHVLRFFVHFFAVTARLRREIS